jgi:hypothetical protein
MDPYPPAGFCVSLAQERESRGSGFTVGAKAIAEVDAPPAPKE